MTRPDLLTRVATSHGDAVVELVDQWVAVTPAGDVLVRDVWRARVEAADVVVDARVLTFPEPTPEALAAALEAELAA